MNPIYPRATHPRVEIADAIVARLNEPTLRHAASDFAASRPTQWFCIDELLPTGMATAITRSFPQATDMRELKSLREHKHVAAQMDRYDPQAEEALFAFHDPRVVALIARITDLQELEADPKLYAGGISVMTKGNFLNPHLDNSHNNERTRYRALNLLYYVSPAWTPADGGNLELWPSGIAGFPLVVPSLFNRLVVMSTGPQSWHSVTRVLRNDRRCCVSNYYFSPGPIGGVPYSRVTTFRGRPEQPLRNFVLTLDGTLRQALRFFFPKGVRKTTHLYEKRGEPTP
jgi:Rps23 Pro-64 3,4-dihydroxylase Tpa1-like proline 4-hydroxylase